MRLILAALALSAVPLYAQEPSPTPTPGPTPTRPPIPCSPEQPLTPAQHAYGQARDAEIMPPTMPASFAKLLMEGGRYDIGSADYREDVAVRRRRFCGADAVVTGVVTSYTTLTSPKGLWVWGEAAVEIEEVLKNNDVAPLTPSATVSVYRPGGSGCINGQQKIVSTGDAPLVEGRRYLLFLDLDGSQYIAALSGYDLSAAEATPAHDGTHSTSFATNGLLTEMRTVGTCEP